MDKEELLEILKKGGFREESEEIGEIMHTKNKN